MDPNSVRDRDFVVDIESCMSMSEEAAVAETFSAAELGRSVSADVAGGLINFDGTGQYGIQVMDSAGDVSSENEMMLINEGEGVQTSDVAVSKMRNERRKPTSAKKPPKPPRPPRGYSLDAADQKLIKEIAKLAMMKRARIERMKALQKMKAAKASSVSSSSGSFLAMLFTIIFCLLIVVQGMFCRNCLASKFHASPEPTGSVESSLMVQYQQGSSVNDSSYAGSESPNLSRPVSGLDLEDKVVRAS